MKDYSSDWPEVAEKIKKKNKYCCEICGHKHDPQNGYCLTVHHLDRNTQNNEEYNLGSLCQRCHLRLEAHARGLEKSGNTIFSQSDFLFNKLTLPEITFTDWFKPHWEGYLRSIKSVSHYYLRKDKALELIK